MYDQYYYTQLYDAVKQRQYKDVPFKLRKLGDDYADFVKSDNMTEFFNKHKDGMMRGILYILKTHDDYGFTGKDFVDVVKGARKIGLAWPELDIIERSAKLMTDIDVDMMEASGRPTAEEIIAEYNYYPIMMMHKLIEQGYTVDNPAVATAIETIKPQLIKVLLLLIKDGIYKNASSGVASIRRIGVNWPELDIIDQSAKSLANTKVVETMRINSKDRRDAMLDRLETIFNDPNTDVFDRIAELDIARNVLRRIERSDVADILAKYKTNIIRDTLHYLRHGVVDVEIPVYLRTLQDLGADWPELQIILRSITQDKNTHELDETTDMTNHGVSMIIDGLEEHNFDLIPYALAIIGAQGHRPTYGFVPAFNENKTEIIRAMLYAIKDPDSYDLWFDGALPYMIKGARMLGLTWDELNKIERSVGSVDELNESQNASTRYNLNGLINSIETDELREAVLFLSQLSWANKLPDMSTELAPHVRSIVKAMLEFLKYEEPDAEPVDTVRDCLEALKKMNIHNKEIDIIDRSLSIGKQDAQQ